MNLSEFQWHAELTADLWRPAIGNHPADYVCSSIRIVSLVLPVYTLKVFAAILAYVYKYIYLLTQLRENRRKYGQ